MAKKKNTQIKYKARRFFLVLLLVGLVGVGGWYVGKNGIPGLDKTPASESSPLDNSSELEPSGQSEPDTEPESQPEPEPAPEPKPVTADWNLLLVSEAKPLPADFVVPELEIITEDYKVDARIAENVRKMFAKAKEDGIDLMICSAYRSVEYQAELFERYKQQEMANGLTEEDAATKAATYSAPPGTSDHHTGLALDIVTEDHQTLDEAFALTPAYRWLDANAYKFGFILRFPEAKVDITKIIYEPWHYRYVGVEHATIIKEKGYCLEEYLYLALRSQNGQQALEDQSQESMESSESSAQ